MRGSVTSGNATSIQTKLDVQVLNAHIVDQLIKGALQKGRVNRADRLQSFAGQPGRKSHAMLFSYADIERAFGKSFQRQRNSGAVGHGSGQSDDLLVLLHQLAQGFAKDLRVSRRLRG